MNHSSNTHITTPEAAKVAYGMPCWSELVGDERGFGNAAAFVGTGSAL